MRSLAPLAVLGLLQLAFLDAVDPSQGGSALGEKHDIELTVSAGARCGRGTLRPRAHSAVPPATRTGSTGKSELDFLLLGEHGTLFSLVNFNNGTLQLRGHDEVRPLPASLPRLAVPHGPPGADCERPGCADAVRDQRQREEGGGRRGGAAGEQRGTAPCLLAPRGPR